MKKVLLFSRDPGGANTIIPLVKILQNRGYEVGLFGKDTSLEKYRNFGLNGKDVKKFIVKTDLKEIKKFLRSEKPDLIITGTSANDPIEKIIWRAAEELSIPSFAILDQWLNYGIRFSEYGMEQLDLYNKKPTHDYLPAKIFVMDNYAKREMRKIGIKSDRIVVSGQPFFDLLDIKKKQADKLGIAVFKKKCGINNDCFTIVFSSEPIEKVYGGKKKALKELGYTEKIILKELLRTLKMIARKEGLKINLIIKIHPKEKPDDFEKILKAGTDKNINVSLAKNYDPWDLILASDLVCGMISMFLLESVLLKKKTLSIQIGLKGGNSFILDQKNVLKSVVKKEELEIKLKKLITDSKRPNYKFNFIKNASLNIINYLEKNYV